MTAPNLYGQFGEDILGPWEKLDSSVQEAWITLSNRVTSRRKMEAIADPTVRFLVGLRDAEDMPLHHRADIDQFLVEGLGVEIP